MWAPWRPGSRKGGLLIAAGAGLLFAVACTSSAGQWQVQNSATAGAAIVLPLRNSEVRIACRLNPSDLYVATTALGTRDSGGSLVLRSGGHSVELSVLSTERGVEAAGPVTGPLLFMLNGRAPMELRYGRRNIRLPALDEATRNAFATACGRSAGVYQPS